MPAAQRLAVFISHSSSDAKLAGDITDLLVFGLNVPAGDIRCTGTYGFGLNSGAIIDEALQHDVNAAAVVIGILSPKALESMWVTFELGARWGCGKPLMLLSTPGMNPDSIRGPLSRLNVIPCNTWGLWQLLQEVGESLGVPLQPPRAIDPRIQRIWTGWLAEYDHGATESAAASSDSAISSRRSTNRNGPAAVLRQEFDQFLAGARDPNRIQNHSLSEWLIAARHAVQDAASVIDAHWDRGQHTITGVDLVPAERPQPGWFPLFTTIVSRAIVDRIQGLPGNLACRIVTDDHGVVRDVPQGSGHTWDVDAIDGSRQMVRSLPLFTTTISLVDLSGRPVLGIVYAPVTGEFFFAVRGVGAFLNNWDSPLHLGPLGADVKQKGLIHMEFPNSSTSSSTEFESLCAASNRVFAEAYRVRGLGLGSLGLAYTAKGAFDAYVTFASGTTKYDVLAGQLLVEAAGGKVVEKDPDPSAPKRDAGGARVRMIGGRPDVVEYLLSFEEIRRLF